MCLCGPWRGISQVGEYLILLVLIQSMILPVAMIYHTYKMYKIIFTCNSQTILNQCGNTQGETLYWEYTIGYLLKIYVEV